MKYNLGLDYPLKGSSLYSKVNQDTVFLSIADAFYPESELDEDVKEKIYKLANDKNINSYENFAGNIELRSKLAKKINRKTSHDISQENILITNGAIQGLLITMIALFNPDDEIIVVEPSYNKNFTIARLLSLNLARVESSAKDGFGLPIEEIIKNVNENTKAILITSPNNPTGRVYKYDELKALSNIAKENDLYLIVDQAYEEIIFDGANFISLSSIGDMLDRTITISSASKAYGLSGFRVGWLYSGMDIIEKIKKAMSLCLGSVNTLGQRVFNEVIEKDKLVENNIAIFKKRRDYFYSKIKSLEKSSMRLPEAGYYAWIDISRLGTCDEVAEKILLDKNILVNPGNYYGQAGESFIRVVYGAYKSDEKIYSYIDDLTEALRELE